MKTSSVRISGITIQNLKNVASGSLSLENTRKPYKASVLGLYGQNGSGKTALIDALELLQYALRGDAIPEKFVHYIAVGADIATLVFDFVVQKAEETIRVSYQFSLKAVYETSGRNVELTLPAEQGKQICIINELLKCPIYGEKKPRMGVLLDTETKELFLPRPKRQLLVGTDRENTTKLIVAKELSRAQSRSFIFSKELLGTIKHREHEVEDDELHFYVWLIDRLVHFGNHELFVINTANLGRINQNTLPLSFKLMGDCAGPLGGMTLPLHEPVVVPQQTREIVTKIIQSMNVVLRQVVPELTIRMRDLGTEALVGGEVGNRIQLMSHKNNTEIPLNYESEGIKRIISILQLLIVIYNQSSITVAVDELDSGIFEHLLGELLRVISEKGRGQLIFTSHNLRPLETLNRGFVAFTTTNPHNRYVRMTGVKQTNNLRDFYYRDLMFGGQQEELYEQTHNAEIALSFREAVL